MKIKKASKSFKWAAFIVLLFVVIFAGITFFGSKNGEKYVTEPVLRGTISEEIKASGKIVPEESVSLAFGRSGLVSSVLVEVGDQVFAGQLLGTLDSRELGAQLSKAEANLLGEQANLREVKKGTRKEEISFYESKLGSAQTDLVSAKEALVVSARDAYVKSDDAIKNYADNLFDNPLSVNPTIDVNMDSDKKEKAINAKRLEIREKMNEWSEVFVSGNINFEKIKDLSKENINFIKNFLQELSDVVDDLDSGRSGLTQAEIDGYSNDLSDARTILNTASISYNSAESAYLSAESALLTAEEELKLKQAGGTEDSIVSGEAKVSALEAEVRNILIQIEDTKIYSPISGLVSKVEIDRGEYENSGDEAFRVLSENSFKIEVQIPEVDISKVSKENSVKVILDAYGESVVFTGDVVSIDPGEIVFEGVPSYKVTIRLNDNEKRVLSGMTANVSIVTSLRENILIVPSKALYFKEGERYVKELVLMEGSSEGDEKVVETRVITGINGNDGYTEVISGLDEGDKVIVRELE
jgi:HlyD family secretion protein